MDVVCLSECRDMMVLRLRLLPDTLSLLLPMNYEFKHCLHHLLNLHLKSECLPDTCQGSIILSSYSGFLKHWLP